MARSRVATSAKKLKVKLNVTAKRPGANKERGGKKPVPPRKSALTLHSLCTPVLAAPCCSQCGRQLQGVPFAMAHIVCRDCYGMDRYRSVLPGHWAPEKPMESTATDETAHAVSEKK